MSNENCKSLKKDRKRHEEGNRFHAHELVELILLELTFLPKAIHRLSVIPIIFISFFNDRKIPIALAKSAGFLFSVCSWHLCKLLDSCDY